MKLESGVMDDVTESTAFLPHVRTVCVGKLDNTIIQVHVSGVVFLTESGSTHLGYSLYFFLIRRICLIWKSQMIGTFHTARSMLPQWSQIALLWSLIQRTKSSGSHWICGENIHSIRSERLYLTCVNALILENASAS